MQQPTLVVLAILLNVGAQVSIKFAGQQGPAQTLWGQLFSPWLVGAVALYGLSFLLTVRIYSVNSLSVAAPFMAACTFMLIYLLGYLLFSEPITLAKSAGLGLIVIGMALVLN